MVLESVSPADPDTVYVTQGSENDHTWLVERVDARRGIATPFPLKAFPFGFFLGVDSAGTAYGWEREASLDGTYTLVRCRSASPTCDRITTDRFIQQTVVDPNSAGTLVTWNAARLLQVSTDGGTSWRPGAAAAGEIGFSGPAPRTLVSLAAGRLSLSRDAGLTCASPPTSPVPRARRWSPSAAVMLGINRGGPFALTGDGGATYRMIGAPAPGDLSIDPKAGIDFHRRRGRPDAAIHRRRRHLVRRRGTRASRFSPSRPRVPARVSTRPPAAPSGSRATGEPPVAHATAVRGDAGPGRRAQRDAPLSTAYVSTRLDYRSGEIRTRDGGATWQPVALPPDPDATITSVAPGDPLHVFSPRRTSGSWPTAAAPGRSCRLPANA